MEASGITTDRHEHDKGRTVATVAGNEQDKNVGRGGQHAWRPAGSPRTGTSTTRAGQWQQWQATSRTRAGHEQDTSRTRRCHEQDTNNAEQTKDTEQTDQGRADTKQRNLYSENAHVVWRSRQLWDYPAFDS